MSKKLSKYRVYKKKGKKKKELKKNNWSFLILRSKIFIFLTKNIFESMRRYISRKFKKKLKFSIYKNTKNISLSKKTQKSRMGKGKGKPSKWIWFLEKKDKLIEFSYLRKKKLIFFFLKKLKKKIPMPFFFLTV